MNTGNSIEQMFAGEHRKRLKEQKKSLEEHVLSHPLPQEEYIFYIGQIKAYSQAIESFEELIKAYFARS